MDLSWVKKAGHDPVKLFEQYPGRFTMVHVKEMDNQDNKLNTEVGTCSVDFRQIFEKVNIAGIQRYILEQENFKINPFISIKQSCDYIPRAIFFKDQGK